MFTPKQLSKIVVPILALALIIALALALGCTADAPDAPSQPRPPAPPAPALPAAAAPAQSVQPALPAAAAPAPPALAALPPPPRAVPSAPPLARAAPAQPTPIPAVFPVTVTDGEGREITFHEPPQKIVAFDSALVEILFAIGEGHRIIATHSFVDYPPEAESIPRVGDAFDMDMEAIVALEPDLVFIFFDRFTEDLERAGLHALYMPTLSDDFIQIADRIRMWGMIVGSPDSAEKVALEFEARVARVEETMSPIGAGPIVFQDVGGYWTPGQGTLMQEVFDLLKLENVAADIQGYAQISPEVIVESDPTIIISSSAEQFTTDPAFANVRAVRNGAIVSISSNALSVASPRFVEGVEELARLVYPGLFR